MTPAPASRARDNNRGAPLLDTDAMSNTTPEHPIEPPARREAPVRASEPVIISCGTCVMASTSACHDCIMSVLCPAEEPRAVVLDLAERRALRLLADAGMVPTLRHRATG